MRWMIIGRIHLKFDNFPQFVMEQVLSAFGMLGWKIALERMQAINLTNDFHTDSKELRLLVEQHARTHKQLGNYLKAARKTTPSPIVLLKQAILLHLHIQLAAAPNQQSILDFASFLLRRCDAVNEMYGEGQGESSKCGVRSQASTREDEPFLGKEVLLVSKVVKPYLRYQQRLLSLLEEFKKMGKKQMDAALAWQLVNLMRGVTGITGHFVMIGRYFIREYGEAVILLAAVLSKDITICVEAIRKYVLERNHSLCCSMADGGEVQQFVSFLEEVGVLNQQLMQVYLGKYFFREMREFQQPQWISLNSSEFDSIFKLAQTLKPPPKPILRQ